MLKVFLAEDETLIREGLRDNIPWEQYGYRFVDLETAANAGMDVIPVCWGFRSREFLIEHGAVSERIVSNVRELREQITAKQIVQK